MAVGPKIRLGPLDDEIVDADAWADTKSWVAGESSNVAGLRYDGDSQELYVEFKGHTIYAYYGVGEEVAKGMFNAASLGKYVWSHLRGKYAYKRIQ